MRYRAYGIGVESDFPIPSLPESGDAAATQLTLRSATSEEIERRAAESPGRCVEQVWHPDGEVGLRIDEHSHGYRMEVGRFGRYFLDARSLVGYCAPPEVEPWRRERFLVARVLPIAALRAGYEVLHASGAEIGGVAVAVLGASGAGKSSIALRLGLRGLPVLTDDLLCVAILDGEAIAYPGPRLIGIREAEHRLLSARDRARLGDPVDRGDKHYGSVGPAGEPVPLRLLYRLCRGGGTDRVSFTSPGPPDPASLLGSTFFAQLQLTEERLVRQLDVYRRLARQAELFNVAIPPGVEAAEVAAELEQHASAHGAAPVSR